MCRRPTRSGMGTSPFTRLWHLLQPEREGHRGGGRVHRGAADNPIAVLSLTTPIAVLSLTTPIAVLSLTTPIAFGILLWLILVIAGVLTCILGRAAAIRAMQVYVVECIQRWRYCSELL